MKDLIIDNGKIRNCSSNWAKMTWYQYGWYFGILFLYRLLRDNYKEGFKSVGKGVYIVIMTTLLFIPLIVIRPFLWNIRVRKARKI